IAKIDSELLYRCYNTFYNLGNMTLAVAGNFEPADVLEAADRILKPAPELPVERGIADEPEGVRTALVEQRLPVAQPLFQLGFKGTPGKNPKETLWMKIADEVLSDVIAGDSTALYRSLYDQELINQVFEAEAMATRDYALTCFSGESREPEKVRDIILAEIKRLIAEGIDPAVFDRVKKAVYGRYIGMYGRPDALAGLLVTAQFSDSGAYDVLEILAGLTLDDLQSRLPVSFNPGRCSLSVIRP
ncbi:MAG: insulinase family protein, partial [Oscillospiraceae bacterium]|nr:insulinase family protein [Oscillospiraceae bacterium]